MPLGFREKTMGRTGVAQWDPWGKELGLLGSSVQNKLGGSVGH